MSMRFEEPAYYADSLIIDAMRTAQSRQTLLLWSAIMDVFRQTYISLATYFLKKHELLLDLGDTSSSGRSLAERRSRTLQRFTAAFLPMNIAGMQKLVQYFVQSATVTHTPATYSFTVQIISPKGIPANLSDIQAAIERSKPAHLNYTLVYTFTTWDAMDAYNRPWNIAETYLWDSLEIS
jgi:hypothetical protein